MSCLSALTARSHAELLELVPVSAQRRSRSARENTDHGVFNIPEESQTVRLVGCPSVLTFSQQMIK